MDRNNLRFARLESEEMDHEPMATAGRGLATLAQMQEGVSPACGREGRSLACRALAGDFPWPSPRQQDSRPAAHYSNRWPVAVAQPFTRRLPEGSKNWTEASGVVNWLGSSPISMVWLIFWVLTSAPFRVINAMRSEL